MVNASKKVPVNIWSNLPANFLHASLINVFCLSVNSLTVSIDKVSSSFKKSNFF